MVIPGDDSLDGLELYDNTTRPWGAPHACGCSAALDAGIHRRGPASLRASAVVIPRAGGFRRLPTEKRGWN